MRALWLSAGLLAVALGLIGIPLPFLPTVPFMLLAAFCFARSSPRLHDWLLRHPVWGPHILRWRKTGSISRRAKRLATIMILLSPLVTLLLGVPLRAVGFQALILCGTLAFIWSRPSE